MLLVAGAVSAQEPARPSWRSLGSTVAEIGLAGFASGPVDRVWYGADGALRAATRDGRVFLRDTSENWKLSPEAPPAGGPAARLMAPSNPARVYRLTAHALRSDDGGLNWDNLTGLRDEDLLGGDLVDLAVSPRDPDEIVIASERGVWRSMDGGGSWSSLNPGLPNLPIDRIVSTPNGLRGMRARTKNLGTLEWLPGEKAAWRVPQQALPGDSIAAEEALRDALTGRLNAPLRSAAMSGTYLYAGANDGRAWISPDQGRTWRTWNFGENASIARLVPDPNDGLTALAVIDNLSGPRVFRTLNGGLLWDDLTANLPDGAAPRSLAFDRATGALYLATSKGLWMTWSNLQAPAAATPWTALGEALPGEAIADVKLDDLGNQLYVAVEGHGIFAANAPHRRRMPLIVHAADYQARPAAPGALLSVMGAAVSTARAATRAVPILAASTDESQVQIPFDVQGSALALTLNGFSRTLPLEPTSPSIFIDRDGAPMLIDADSGVILDAMNPARPGMRLQILAAGLGRVRPDWPAGVPAPLDNTPQVVAPVRVLIDRIPVDVVKATLAPGYVGFYLIEVQLPAFVNAGPAELYLEAGGRESNRTRLWLQP